MLLLVNFFSVTELCIEAIRPISPIKKIRNSLTNAYVYMFIGIMLYRTCNRGRQLDNADFFYIISLHPRHQKIKCFVHLVEINLGFV